tara:strand:+ start:692 stop:898 length:207 start_codon:yes stop_codon:yes gene_type:complete
MVWGKIKAWLASKEKRDVYISRDRAESDKPYLERTLESAGFDLNGRATTTDVNEHVVCYSHVSAAENI